MKDGFQIKNVWPRFLWGALGLNAAFLACGQGDSATETAMDAPVLVANESAPAARVGQIETTVVESTLDPSPVPVTGPRSRPTPAPTPSAVVDQVVISATRTPKLIEDVPTAITVIDATDIARIAPLSFDDLTRTVPNVEFLGGPRYLGEQLIVRGEGGSAVSVRIDDARQNFVSGHAGQRFFVETDFLKEAEILRGGGSFLYGSGSAGVINLTTLDPEDIIRDERIYGLRLRNTYNSNTNEWTQSLIGAVGNEEIGLLIGGSTRDGQNIEQPGGVELPFSATERDSGIGKLVYTPSEDTRLEFGFTEYESIDRGGANPQALAVGTSDNALVDRVVTYEQLTGDWSWNPEFNDLVDVKASIYYNTTNQRRNYADVVGSNAGRFNVHNLAVYGIDANNRSIAEIGGRQHEFVYGIDFFHEVQDGVETRDTFFIPGSPGNSSGRPDAQADHLGFYLTDEIEATENLTLFAGIRYDTYESIKTEGISSQQQDSAFLPQVGFDLDVTERVSLFGQFSRGFTAPTLNDLYQDGSHFGVVPGDPFFETIRDPQGGFFFPAFTAPPPGLIRVNYFEEVFVPNPDLLPEETDNFELGVHFEDDDFFGGSLTTRVNGFYKKGINTFDTQIVGTRTVSPFAGGFATPPDEPAQVVNPPGAVVFTGIDFEGQLVQAFRQSVNREETEIYGFEFSADYDAETWFAGLDIGIIRGRDTVTGQKLNSITGDQVALTLGMRPRENLEFGVQGLWNGGREDLVSDPFLRTSGYDLYNLFGSLRVTDCWTIRGGVDNVFDQTYERTSNLLIEPGRNAFISSTIEW